MSRKYSAPGPADVTRTSGTKAQPRSSPRLSGPRGASTRLEAVPLFRSRHVNPHMRPDPARRLRRLLELLLVGLLGAIAACDNPACVYSATGCGTVGIGDPLGAEATTPFDGARIRDGLPRIEAVYPSGSNINPDSPIVIQFSESMNQASLQSAFRLVDSGDFSGFPIGTTSVLTGDDQLLVLFPVSPLPSGGSIQVIFQNDNQARDLTGQVLDAIEESVVGSFAVAAGTTNATQLLTTWPPANADDVNPQTEIITVFDRDMTPAPFATDAFQVTIDGNPPSPDPVPSPIELLSLGSTNLTDPRVWVYRRTTASGELATIDPGSTIEVSLSVGGNLDPLEGDTLDPQVVSFSTPAFAAPISVSLASTPNDAIGLANLVEGSSELQVAVELSAASPDDTLSLFAFGTSLEDGTVLAAVQSDVVLGDSITSQVLSLSETPLLASNAVGQAIFADGDVVLAARQTRGSVVGPLRVLDLDAGAQGVQSVVLDTVAPTLDDLDLPGGGGDLFLSELRDFTLTGRASEELRAVDVVVTDLPGAAEPLENSGEAFDVGADFVPVVGSTKDGGFIAAPVRLGIVPTVAIAGTDAVEVPALSYEFTLYDRALNASQAILGTFNQRGTVTGPEVNPGETITVEVVDASTLQPLANALVVWADLSNDDVNPASVSNVQSTLTGVDGRAQITAQATETILTVDADGFDLVTFQGLETGWCSVLIQPTGGLTAQASGAISGGSLLTQQVLPADTLRVADSRRGGVPETFPTDQCEPNPFTGLDPICTFGPEPIDAGRVGAQAIFLGDFDLPSQGQQQEYLKGFELTLPVPPTAANSLSVVDAEIAQVFATSEIGVESEDLPVSIEDVLTFQDVSGFASELDETSLIDDPTFVGTPTVNLEARFPGLVRPAMVGVGRAFEDTDTGAKDWEVEAIFDPDLIELADEFSVFEEVMHFSMVLEDVDGDRSTVRPRLSQPTVVGNFRPTLVSRLVEPTGSVGPGDFELVFWDSLVEPLNEIYLVDGIFRVRLEDAVGRRWEIYRLDSESVSSDSTRELQVFALSSTDGGLVDPGDGLAAGSISAEIDFFALRDGRQPLIGGPVPDPEDPFERTNFAWSDLPLQSVLISESRPYVFTLDDGSGL